MSWEGQAGSARHSQGRPSCLACAPVLMPFLPGGPPERPSELGAVDQSPREPATWRTSSLGQAVPPFRGSCEAQVVPAPPSWAAVGRCSGSLPARCATGAQRPCPHAMRLPAGRCRRGGTLGGRGASEARRGDSSRPPRGPRGSPVPCLGARPFRPSSDAVGLSRWPGFPAGKGRARHRVDREEPAPTRERTEVCSEPACRPAGGRRRPGDTAGGCVRLHIRSNHSPPGADALSLLYFLKIYLLKKPACL